LQLEERDSSANFWLMKAQDQSGGRDVLVWVGFNSEAMGREISAQAPSFFFGVRDDRENAEFSYHSDYRG